MILWYRTGNI